jgi:hypothetical protein
VDIETPANGYAWDVGPDPEETASGRAHIPWRERYGRVARQRKAAEREATAGEPQRHHLWTILVGLTIPIGLILLGIGFLLAPDSSDETNDTALPPAATLPPGETAPPAAPPVEPATSAGTASSAPGPEFTDPQQEAMALARQLTNALAQHDFAAARSISAEPKDDDYYAERYPFAEKGTRAQVSLVPVEVTPAGPNLFSVRALLQARVVASGKVTFVCAQWVVDATTGKITDRGAAVLDGVNAADAPKACQSADLG